jgi:hypothetical protein
MAIQGLYRSTLKKHLPRTFQRIYHGRNKTNAKTLWLCKYCIAEVAPTHSKQRLLKLYNLLEILYHRWRYQMIFLAEKKLSGD